MEIIHERPSQRLHYRVAAPMRVTLGERTFTAADWGLGGCRLAGLSDDLPASGSTHTLFCTLPFQGFNITLKTEATVVRVDAASGEVAFSFTKLGERETALMQHFIEDLVRGKMTDVADTIVRIDTPVTPVPVKPDPNPVDAMPVRRWPVKQIMMTLFYFALGAVVFGYVGIYIFATLFRLEVQTAVIAAERLTVTAPVTGIVSENLVRPGDEIAVGQALAAMDDTDHGADLRRARAALASTTAELAETETLLAEEKRKSEGYALVARNNVRQAESQLVGMELARDNALLKVERMRDLSTKGLVRADDLEAAELDLESVVSDLERKKIHIEELKELIAGGDSIRLFTGNAFAGRLAEMDARVARLKAEKDHQEDVVASLAGRSSRQMVRSPLSGRIVNAPSPAGSAIKQGEALFVLEETGAETVQAFLTQEEVLQVRIGTRAKLYLPAEGRWLEAKVSTVDRTAGFVDEISETYRFRAPDARSAQIVLTPRGADLPPSGTPVVVYFERHRNNLVWRTAEQLLEAF